MADLIENCKRHRVMIGLLTVLGPLLLGARAQQQEFGLVGSDVTLVPKYTGDVKEITWTLDDRIFVEIILKPQEEFTHPLPNDRATINKANGALTIRYLNRGDSGLYKAQMIVDNSVQVTEIRLTVRDCPDQPTISVQSTEDWFVVSCKSFSPEVTYEWFNPTTSVSKSQLYTVPKKNRTLTCVVDNEVCNKRSSINFYIPEEKSVTNDVILVPKYTGDPSEIIWRVNGYKLVKMMLKPQVDRIFYRLEDRAIISETDGSLTIWKLTREDSGDYTAVVLVNNDYHCTEIRLKHSGLSGWSITGIVIGVFTLLINFIIHLLLWYYCCIEYSRLPEGKIAGKVFVVVTLIAMINFFFLLLYYGYKKSWGLSGGDVFPVVVGVLLLIPITIFLLRVYCYYTKEKIEELSARPGMTIYTSKDSNIEGAEESERCITVKFCNDKSQTEESCIFWKNDSKGTQSPRLNLHEVESVGEGNFMAVMSDEEEDTFTDGTETSVKIDSWADRKKHCEQNTIHVKELVWKKDGVTQFKWAFSSLKFLTNNIKLKRESVTVYDAEGKKSYKVFFRLEGHPVSMSITFHPIKMTNIEPSTWKKDSKPVYIGGDRIKCEPNGDLTINNATSKDKGKYTVQCKDNDEDQEFILHL